MYFPWRFDVADILQLGSEDRARIQGMTANARGQIWNRSWLYFNSGHKPLSEKFTNSLYAKDTQKAFKGKTKQCCGKRIANFPFPCSNDSIYYSVFVWDWLSSTHAVSQWKQTLSSCFIFSQFFFSRQIFIFTDCFRVSKAATTLNISIKSVPLLFLYSNHACTWMKLQRSWIWSQD